MGRRLSLALRRRSPRQCGGGVPRVPLQDSWSRVRRVNLRISSAGCAMSGRLETHIQGGQRRGKSFSIIHLILGSIKELSTWIKFNLPCACSVVAALFWMNPDSPSIGTTIPSAPLGALDEPHLRCACAGSLRALRAAIIMVMVVDQEAMTEKYKSTMN